MNTTNVITEMKLIAYRLVDLNAGSEVDKLADELGKVAEVLAEIRSTQNDDLDLITRKIQDVRFASAQKR